MARSSTESDSVLLTYSEEITPVVDDVNPRRGGTGGGTDITITGRNFGYAYFFYKLSENTSVKCVGMSMVKLT